jgi:hypothetical protein
VVLYEVSEESHQDGESSVQKRWNLVNDFVEAINQHRDSCFTPSEVIRVDESVSRWYQQGGHWIEHGLPHYVAIDRKPENGCEIQNSACGRSGVMLCLQFVTTADDEVCRAARREAGLLHGTVVLQRLVLP